MFLRTLELKNFKCLEDISISFVQPDGTPRKRTLILGENGTGKSNVLKSIALVTSGSSALGDLMGQMDQWITYKKKYCEIKATLQTKDGEFREIGLRINRGDSLSSFMKNNRGTLEQIDSAIAHSERNYFVVGYGSSRRLGMDHFSNSDILRHNRSQNVRNLFDSQAVLNPLTQWIINLDYVDGEQGLKLVKETLKDFLPDVSFHGIDKVKKTVLFKTADGVVPLDQLSDGYQNMAGWIGDLLYRVTATFQDYKKPLEARGLLLIDEVDLHLHPKWQRRLLDFITSKLPHFQMVATSHSPLTAQQADEGELFTLRRNEQNKIEPVAFLGSPKQLLVNQLLMTPVFGLETDESVEIQKAKKTYRELNPQNNRLSIADKKKLQQAKVVLKEKLPNRTSTITGNKELKMLQDIASELKKKKV